MESGRRTAARRAIELDALPARIDALRGTERVRAAAAATGLKVFLVGGSVRDALLGIERGDLDVVVEGDHLALAAALGGEVHAYAPFLTATVTTPDGEIDVSAARTESYAYPGALPTVRPGTLAEDLARRDFTINAIAVPLLGELRPIDPHGGIEDLRAGLLRVLHDNSFSDDPTRALRAARYAALLDLRPEPRTLELLREADLSTVSSDRVEAELRRIAASAEPRRALELLAGWGLFTLPPDRAELVEAVSRLAGQPPWREAVDRAEAVLAAARGSLDGANRLAALRPQRPSEAVAAARGRSATELLLARALGAEWLDPYLERWRDVRLRISGHDLIAAGVEQGPAVGEGLGAALRAKLDGEVSSRDEELAVALAAARRRP